MLSTGVQIILGPTVTRSNRSVPIYFDIQPPDVRNENSGITSATRIYRDGDIVNLYAYSQYKGRKFSYWEIERSNGSKELFTENDIFINIDSNMIARCIYEPSILNLYPEFLLGQIGYTGSFATTLETGIQFLVGQIGFTGSFASTLVTGVETEIL